MFELTDIYCPECGDRVEDVPPENYIVPGGAPEYRHVSDGTALCPVTAYRRVADRIKVFIGAEHPFPASLPRRVSGFR